MLLPKLIDCLGYTYTLCVSRLPGIIVPKNASSRLDETERLFSIPLHEFVGVVRVYENQICLPEQLLVVEVYRIGLTLFDHVLVTRSSEQVSNVEVRYANPQTMNMRISFGWIEIDGDYLALHRHIRRQRSRGTSRERSKLHNKLRL